MTTTHECIAATELYIVAKELRQELKEWEQSFAAAHQGRKAERADIKLHPDIGQMLLSCYTLSFSADDNKHTSTSSTNDCEDLLQGHLSLIKPLLQ